ncbi:MAG: hypothetical protein ABIW50_07920 [Candidatus Limnocylindria bacterium]
MTEIRAAGVLLEFRGIDLGSSVEQVLFTSLRAGGPLRVGLRRRLPRLLRRPVAALSALRRTEPAHAADVLVIALADVHRRLFAPVAAEFARLDPSLTTTLMSAGRGAQDPRLAELPAVSRQLKRRSAIALMGHRVDRRRLAHAAQRWDTIVGGRVADELVPFVADTIARLAVEAARIDDTLEAVRPRAVVMYDEIDVWSRLVVRVARRHDVAAVDLPHAEAIDVEAIRGAHYDLMGVFGPRAAAVLSSAGVPDDRIVVVGPAGFDPLVRSARSDVDRPPRVILAAQYRGGRMTDQVRAGILDGALAAARAIDATVDLVPHPTEPASAWDEVVANRRHGSRGEVRIASRDSLHDLLPGSALLVTGWSNSVYEAVLAGVPAITCHLLEGPPPMPFASEGLASEARDEAAAADHARDLMRPERRQDALATARSALADHLGPLDGAAATRSAALVARAARG